MRGRDQVPWWVEYGFLGIAFSAGHFFLLGCCAAPLVWSPYAFYLGVPLTLPAVLVETLLTRYTDYHGQDAIQWPLAFANSLLYGYLIAFLWMRWRVARRRILARRFPEGRCSNCGYDLRGLLAAGVHHCPECGTRFAKSATAQGAPPHPPDGIS